MKWNGTLPDNPGYTSAYLERENFWFSDTIILPHPWKYLPTLTLKSHYIYKLCGDLAQTLLIVILKGFKKAWFIYDAKISETILTMLALNLSYKKMKLPKFQVIVTLANLEHGSLFLELTGTNSLNLNKKVPLNSGRDSQKII